MLPNTKPYSEDMDYNHIRDLANDIVKMVDERGHLGIMLATAKEIVKLIYRIDKHSEPKG